MNRPQLISVFFASFAFLMSAPAVAQDAIEFSHIWIAEAPPGSQVMAAYMDIKNTSNEILRIKPPQAADFKKIEFHRTFHENGMARMQRQPELFIPAQSTISLEPGSYHMMLFNPTRKLKAGDESTFYFQIREGQKDSKDIKIVAPVKKPVYGQADHSNHH
jgi:copper(I)-binding protein